MTICQLLIAAKINHHSLQMVLKTYQSKKRLSKKRLRKQTIFDHHPFPLTSVLRKPLSLTQIYEAFSHIFVDFKWEDSSIENVMDSKNEAGKEWKRHRKLALVLGIAAIIVAIYATLASGGIMLGSIFGSSEGLSWNKQTVGSEGLVVSFPKTFENAEELINQIPPTAKVQFKKIEASIAGFNKDFIAIAFTLVKSESDTGNLSRYAEMGLGLLTGNRTIDKSSFELKEYTIDNNPAILQRGTFNAYQDKKITFSLLLTGKDRNFWLVMIVAPENDRKAQRIARKFIRSVRIEKE